MNGQLTQNRQVEDIKARVREHFPESEITVRHDAVDDRWLLLLNDNGVAHRITAASLDALLNIADNPLEYEDGQDQQKMR
jgi:hypothetical protein